MSNQPTAAKHPWIVVAGADPRDKGIMDTSFGHYGVTFATVSFAHEYSHMPDYGATLAADYAERIVANAGAAAEIDRLRAVNAELLAALDGAWIRMDRARDLLTGGAPTAVCNWGMLDTSLDRAAIKNATA